MFSQLARRIFPAKLLAAIFLSSSLSLFAILNVGLSGTGGIVENWDCHAVHFQRAVYHPCRYVGQKALGEHELLIFEPEFNLCAKVGWVLNVRPEHGQDFCKYMSVR